MNTTPIRTFRCPDEVWERAQAKARREGKPLSTVLRRMLSQYGRS